MKSGKSFAVFILILGLSLIIAAGNLSAQNAKESSFKRADRLQKLLGLSELQKTRVLNILIQYEHDGPRGNRTEKFSAGAEKIEAMDNEIEQVLTVEQAVKFEKVKYSWMGKRRLKHGLTAEPGSVK